MITCTNCDNQAVVQFVSTAEDGTYALSLPLCMHHFEIADSLPFTAPVVGLAVDPRIINSAIPCGALKDGSNSTRDKCVLYLDHSYRYHMTGDGEQFY